MNQCPHPINTATDLSIEWCQENGHCGCVPYSLLRQKYGEALYPVSHTETITCPRCGLTQDVLIYHDTYGHGCPCGYWMTESDNEFHHGLVTETSMNLSTEQVQTIIDFGNRIGLDWAIVLTEACKKNGRPLDSIPMGWKPSDVVHEVFSKNRG